MIENELLRYGYLFVAAGTVLEGDATLLAAAFLAHRGYLRLSWVLAVAGCSTLAASQIYYLLARRAGERWLEAPASSESLSSSPRMRKIIAWSRERGGLLLLASRFMVGFRTLIPVVCGATGMPPGRFFAWNLGGAAIWSLAFGYAGYAGGHVLTLLVDDARRHEWFVAMLLGAGVTLAILWRTHGRDLADIWRLRRAIHRNI
ncbi:MAG: DedA family protein [Bryobacteraceae bacterium]